MEFDAEALWALSFLIHTRAGAISIFAVLVLVQAVL
jgi:hypothetical protein